jgi:hypothetical protein
MTNIIEFGEHEVATPKTQAPIFFDAWSPDTIAAVRKQMFSPEAWRDFRETLLMALLVMALLVMRKSKSELVEASRKTAAENLETLRALHDLLRDAEGRFRGLADTVAAASARHLIAMAAYAEGWEARS